MKKMIVKTALLITLSTLLSSCEMQMQHRVEEWYKEGVSKKDTDTKLAKCTYDVGMNKVNSVQESRLINACMEGEGFRWIPPRIEYR